MSNNRWPARQIKITNLFLDAKNPRLSRSLETHAQSDLIESLWRDHKAGDIAQQIAAHGYYPNEPLLAVSEDGKTVVVEGNRRLAALKALRDPALLPQPFRRRAENLAKRAGVAGLDSIPVVVAPSRRDTDQQLAGRHTMASVLPWEAENRAAFILEKLREGRTTQELVDELGFKAADIQDARKTQALASMARSIELPDDVQDALNGPKKRILSNVERVFDSEVGRKHFHATPDFDGGLRFNTTAAQFRKAYSKLLTDLARGTVDSRRLNKVEDIQAYFGTWPKDQIPKRTKTTFLPSAIISARSQSPHIAVEDEALAPRAKKPSTTVIPKQFRCLNGSDRIKEICQELKKIHRHDFPNAGAVLLRVFLELSVLDYLERTGDLARISKALADKNSLKHGTPEMKHLLKEMKRICHAKLPKQHAQSIERALSQDSPAPLSINSLHAFVHQPHELPTARDLQQFWSRTEPMFILMLSEPTGEAGK